MKHFYNILFYCYYFVWCKKKLWFKKLRKFWSIKFGTNYVHGNFSIFFSTMHHKITITISDFVNCIQFTFKNSENTKPHRRIQNSIISKSLPFPAWNNWRNSHSYTQSPDDGHFDCEYAFYLHFYRTPCKVLPGLSLHLVQYCPATPPFQIFALSSQYVLYWRLQYK